MKTLIITMSVEEELAEAAAIALNGQTFPVSQRWPALLDQISDFLSDKGYPPGIAADATEVSEYIHQNTVSDNWPSRDSNIFTAVVFADEPLPVARWIEEFRRAGFVNSLTIEERVEIFRTVLKNTDSVSYETLSALVEECIGTEPEDFILLRNHTDVPGFDDISYLLKDKDSVETNCELYVEAFSYRELSWLYEHNRDTINRWIADQQVDLLELSEEGDSGNVIRDVTVMWAKATIDTYLQMGGEWDDSKPGNTVSF